MAWAQLFCSLSILWAYIIVVTKIFGSVSVQKRPYFLKSILRDIKKQDLFYYFWVRGGIFAHFLASKPVFCWSGRGQAGVK